MITNIKINFKQFRTRSDSSKQMEAIVAQLNESNSEKAELQRRLEESEKLVSRYSSSIENLHAVLEQYEKSQLRLVFYCLFA